MRKSGLMLGIIMFFLAQSLVVSGSDSANRVNGFSRTLTPVIADSPEDFSFAIISDRTALERGNIFEKSMDKINLLPADLVISIGDIIEGYSGIDNTKKEWDEALDILSNLKVPFFKTPGNHDISSTDDLKEWHRRFGPTYYGFVFKKVLFVVLNSEGYRSAFPPDKKIDGYEVLNKQNEWLSEILKQHKDVRWTFIFLHNPVWDYDDEIPPKWLEVEKMLRDRPYTVFAGHMHEYTKETRNNRDYITLATTGGGSDLKGIDYGQFDHITLVSLKNGHPVIANLMLSGIQDKNVREKEWREQIKSLKTNVTIEPVFDNGNTFSKGLTRFRIKNNSNRTMSLKAETVARGGVTAEIKPAAIELRPAMEQVFDLEMKSDKPIFYGDIKPITLTFINSIERPSGGIFDLKQKFNVYPQTRFYCPLPPANISIDGDLKEWGKLPFSSVAGVHEDLMEKAVPPLLFAVAADSKYLYIAGRILDDELFFSEDKYNNEQDGMMIMLDARKDPERSKNRDGGEILTSGENQVITLAGLVKSKVGHAFIGDLPDNSIVKGTQTDGGYSVEVAIPMTYLNSMSGETCRAFRLNVGISDIDPSKGGSGTQNMWRPDRFIENALPGAGTFLLEEIK